MNNRGLTQVLDHKTSSDACLCLCNFVFVANNDGVIDVEEEVDAVRSLSAVKHTWVVS